MKGTSGGFVNSINKTFSALEYAEDDEKLIEIFDVLIKTKNRLVIVDPSAEAKRDIHGTLEYINLAESVLNRANYEHRMDKKEEEEENNGDVEEDRTVYDLSSV